MRWIEKKIRIPKVSGQGTFQGGFEKVLKGQKCNHIILIEQKLPTYHSSVLEKIHKHVKWELINSPIWAGQQWEGSSQKIGTNEEGNEAIKMIWVWLPQIDVRYQMSHSQTSSKILQQNTILGTGLHPRKPPLWDSAEYCTEPLLLEEAITTT